MAEKDLDSSAEKNEVAPGRDRGTREGVRRPTLDELIAGIEPGNVHGEMDWGPDVGKERWWVQP